MPQDSYRNRDSSDRSRDRDRDVKDDVEVKEEVKEEVKDENRDFVPENNSVAVEVEDSELEKELEFLEMNKLFENEKEKFCIHCKFEKDCLLLAYMNGLASKNGAKEFNDTFACNRIVEKTGE